MSRHCVLSRWAASACASVLAASVLALVPATAAGASSEGVPGVPGAISASWNTTTPTTLDVTWTSPGGSYLEYQVLYRVDTNEMWDPSPGYSSTNWQSPSGVPTVRTTSRAITGLSATSTYVVAVRARDRATGRYGGWGMSGLIEPTGTPGRPSGITETARTASSLSVQWSKAADAAGGYEVRVSENTTPRAWGTAKSVAQPGSGSSVTAAVGAANLPSGFSTAKTYLVQVRSKSASGTCGSGSVKCSRWVQSALFEQLDISGVSVAQMQRTRYPSWVRFAVLDSDVVWDALDVAGVSYEVRFHYRYGDPASYYDATDDNSVLNAKPDGWVMDWQWWLWCSDDDAATNPPGSRGCADPYFPDRDYERPVFSFGGAVWGPWVPLTAVQAKCSADTRCEHTFEDVTVAYNTDRVQVRGVLGAKKGPATTSSTLPPRVPAQPYDLVSSAPTGASFKVEWNRAFHRGSPISGFDIRLVDPSAPGTAVRSVTGTKGTPDATKPYRFSYVFHSVPTNATYRAEVRAVNGIGPSGWSHSPTQTLSPTAPAVPLAPTLSASTASSVTLAWSAPADDGGSAVTGYGVRYRAQNANGTWPPTWTAHTRTGTGTTATETVASLTAGTTYQFAVRASNASASGGATAWSGWSDALTVPFRLPISSAPTLVSGDMQIVASWGAASPNGSAVLDYDTRWREARTTSWTEAVDTVSTALTTTITGLTNAKTYEVQVRAGNANGDGAWSASATITAGLPAAPDMPALNAGGVSLTAHWTAPADNGSTITGYDAEYSDDNGATWRNRPISYSGATATISGLSGATEYSVRVRAKNAAGAGGWSPVAKLKPGVPAWPTGLASVSGNAQLALSWTASADNGSTVTDYDVQHRACTATDALCLTSPAWGAWADRVGETTADTGTSVTLINLTNAKAYQVRVRAASSAGEGGWAPAVTDAPGRPSAPSAPTVTAGGRQLSLAWSPAAANGLAVTDYDVRYRVTDTDDVASGNQPGAWVALAGAADPGTGTTASITGLVALQSYEVQVRASSAAGAGPWSPTAAAAPSAAAPDAPALSGLSVTAAALTARWTEPASHGSAITDYDVQYRACTATPTDCSEGAGWGSWTPHSHTGTATQATIGTLTAGTAYQVQARATNAVGSSAWSSAVAAMVGAPNAPTGVTVSGADAKLSVSWTAPADNGAAVDDYDMRIRRAGTTTWTRVLSAGADQTLFSSADSANHTDNPLDWGGWGANFTKESLGSHGGLYKANSAIDEMWAYFLAPYTNKPGLKARLCTSSTKPTDNLYTSPSPCTVAAERTAQLKSNVLDTYEIIFGGASNGIRLGDIPQNSYIWMATSEAATTRQFRARTIFGVDLAHTGTDDEIGDLTNGTAYEVQVRAGNARGDGVWSATAVGTPSNAVPSAPAAPALASGNAQITATWAAPGGSGGDPFDYDVRYRSSTDSGSTWSGWSESFDEVSWTRSSLSRVTSNANNGDAMDLGSPSLTGVTVAKPSISGVSDVYRINERVGGLYVSVGAVVAQSSPPQYEARYAPTPPTSSNMTTHGTRLWLATPHHMTKRFSGAGWTPALPAGSHFWVAALGSGDATGVTPTIKIDSASTALSRTLSSLTNGNLYQVQVRGGNHRGDGSWSPSAQITAGLPASPAAPTLAAGGGGQTNGTSLTAAWTAPNGNGNAVSGYDVRYSADSGATWTSWTHSGTTASAAITGLASTTAYVVQVRAENSVGTGPWSTSSAALEPGVPATAAAPTSASGSAQVTVSWDAPGDHGSTITDYDVRYRACTAADLSCATSPAWGPWTDRTGETSADTGRSVAVTGLTNGTAYQVQVRAANSVGEGAWSPAVTDLPGRPPAPGTPTVTAGARQLSVTWTAVTPNGLAVTDYDVQYRVTDTNDVTSGNQPGAWVALTGAADPGTSTSATITGLTALEGYDVQVRASSSAGAGPWSATASQTTAAGAPDAPTQPSLEAGGTQIVANWSRPANTHGSALNDYDVRYCDVSTGCDASNEWTALDDTGSNAADTATTATITGLTDTTTYVVQVRAGNGVGDGPWSASSGEVAAGAPNNPAGLSVDVGNGKLTVSWSAPTADNGDAVNDYDLRYRKVGASNWTRVLSPGVNLYTWHSVDTASHTDDPLDLGDWGASFTRESLGSNLGLYKANNHIDEMWVYFIIPYDNKPSLGARLCMSATKPTANLYTSPSPCTSLAYRAAQQRTPPSGTVYDITFGTSSSGLRLRDISQNSYVWVATSEAATTRNLRQRRIFGYDLRSTALSGEVTGLTNGTAYEMQVRAANVNGDGGWSASVTGTPSTN